MQWKRLWRYLVVLMLLLFGGYVVFAIIGITYSPNVPIPGSIVVSANYNLCVDFVYNEGSGEFMYLFSHWCNAPLKLDNFHYPTQSSYIDMRMTMECPQYEIADKNNDGISEIYITQNRPCKEFAHPWDNDPKQLAFTFASNGKFVDISR